MFRNTRVAALGAVLALLACSVTGQTIDDHDAVSGALTDLSEREFGEEWQIQQRERWFIESRGLDRVNDAGERRAKAVQGQIAEMRAQAPELLGVGPRWESVGPSPMTMLSWTMGQVAGRVTALSVRPGDDNTLYLGTAAGGLWKSTNAGAVWTRLSDALDSPSIGSVAAFAGSGSAPDEVWVGTGEAYAGGCYGYFGRGLYYSNNGGTTFSTRNGSGSNTLNLSFIYSIARHPTSTQILLVGGGGKCSGGSTSGSGLYRSTDNGGNWTRVINVGSAPDVMFDPGNGNIAYAAVNNSGIYKSTDAGATWSLLAGGLPATAGSVRLAMAPSNSSVLYALAGSPVGLYRSGDAGGTWTLANAAACQGQCTYNLTLDVSPTDPNTLVVGTIRHALSTDGGTTLTIQTSSWGSGQKVHQDTHVVRYSRSNSQRYWVGSDGGLWRTDDAGGTYANLNAGLTITQFYDIALDPRGPDRIYGGAQDNSSSLRNANNIWNVTIVTGDGFMNAAEPDAGAANGQRVYQTSYPDADGPSINRSTNFGASGFAGLANTGIDTTETFQWVTPLVVTHGTLFTASSFVYRGDTSQAAGAFTWTKISPTLTTGGVSVLSPPDAAGISPLRLYAGTTNGKLWVTPDALAASPTWTEVAIGLSGAKVTDIATQPGNANIVYATRAAFGSAKLHKSTDGGTTWNAVGTGLPDVPANSVCVDTAVAQRIFVGTDIGIYESNDGGANFHAMMTGLPTGTVVSDIEISANPHRLVIGTYGSGAWRFSLDEPSDRIFYDGFGP